MNHNHIPTEQEEQVAVETNAAFSKQMQQFKDVCGVIHDLESNLTTIGNEAFKAALLSLGRAIQTDDGMEWRHDLDLSKITSICHRRTEAGLEFAVVECLPLPSGETKEVLNRGHNVRDVLREFIHDQKQVLNLWKDDVKEQVKEYLDKNYPRQDMSIVVESFEIKMSRAISERPSLTQNQSRGIRV
jgi:urease gamma subunit